MLESIYIEAYRTLRKTMVDFCDGLNVIIGKNGVGKSNLLGFIANSTGIRLYINGVGAVGMPVSNYSYKLKGTNSNGVEFSFEIAIEKIKPYSTEDYADMPFIITVTRREGREILSTPDYYNASNKDRKALQRGFLEVRPFYGAYVRFSQPEALSYLSNPTTIDINVDTQLSFKRGHPSLRMLYEFENFLESRYQLWFQEEGLDNLPLIREAAFKAFEDSIGYTGLNQHLNNFTNIRQVRLSQNANIYKTQTGATIDNLILEFLIDDLWMPWNNLSDGTKRTFQIIVEVIYAHYELVLIEEPEIGLHPAQLFKIMTFLKEQAQEKQIIISTHSPEVLNVLEADELDNIIIATIEKGRTSFHRLSEHKKEKARTYMTEVGDLSSYWLHSDMEEPDETAEVSNG